MRGGCNERVLQQHDIYRYASGTCLSRTHPYRQEKCLHVQKISRGKIQELTGIIADAEQMIEELNRFSGYILEQVDLRNEELNRSIREAEQKIDALAEKACLTGEGRDITEKKSPVREAVNGKAIPVNGAPGAGSDEKADSAGICVAPRPAGSVAAAYSRNSVCISPGKKEKVIQFNKYQEVLRLSKEGMDEIEIAKTSTWEKVRSN